MNDERRDTTTIPATTGTRKDAIDFARVNESLLQANRDCIDRTVPLVQMLMKAKTQFGYYVVQHKEKGTPDGDAKAGVNQQFVDEIDETLRQFRESAAKEPDPIEQAMAAGEEREDMIDKAMRD